VNQDLPGVNFINVLRTPFSYESLFGSFWAAFTAAFWQLFSSFSAAFL